MSRIPVSIGILTFNSGATLRRALESVKDFDDIIVCDGGSADDTLAIAAEFGARVVLQNRQFLEQDGRIRDYSGVRNQTLGAAEHPWFFFLDSDEYISSELAAEVQEAAAGEPGVFWVPRKYVYSGRIVRCSVAYPSQQMRFFHRSLVQQFAKKVHERIELAPGTVPMYLAHPMLVPLPNTALELRRKWRGYIALESARQGHISVAAWLRLATHEGAVALLYIVRFARINLFCKGEKLPFAYEWSRVWYQLALILSLSKNIRL